jgi:hypothetical protein
MFVVAGAVIALYPFRGSTREGGATVHVDCGVPLRAVNAVDTRPKLRALARLAAHDRGRSSVPPSAGDIARYERLAASAREYTACRGGAARRMTLADVLVALGIAGGIGAVWSRRSAQRASATARD